MQNQTDDSAKQDLVDRAFGSPNIPDPTAWVDEHYFLANFANTLAHIQQHLSDDSCEIGHCSESDEARLSLDAQVRDMLKASFSDDCWEYVESLL